MSQAEITPAEGQKFSHVISHEGQNIGLIFPEGDLHHVELPRSSRIVRNLNDAATYIGMVLSGEWEAVSSGYAPSPIK